MNELQLIDSLSLPALFLVSILFALLCIYAGAQLSKLVQHDDSGLSGPVVGAILGLLAFVLAFTFNMSANRFDVRKQLLIDEVNAIQTCYLRTDLIQQPYRQQAQKLIQRYVAIRIEILDAPEFVMEKIEEADTIQDQLWSMVVIMNEKDLIGASQRLYVQSLNDMFDIQTKRVTVAVQTRIPSTIWLGLYFVAAFAMLAVGYQFSHKQRISIWLNLVLAMVFSAVLTLIADLDRAASGTVGVNQQPMIDLDKKLNPKT